MVRNVRNFYLQGSIDGRATAIQGGPVARGGGFDLTITQRDNGSIITAARISGHVTSDGELILTLTPGASHSGRVTGSGFRVTTNR